MKNIDFENFIIGFVVGTFLYVMLYITFKLFW